jgi:hypothetical protein
VPRCGRRAACAREGEATYAAISAALKELFTKKADGQPLPQPAMYALEVDELKIAYRSLGLMNTEGAFTVKQLDGKKLLETFDAAAFIDQMAGCAGQNPYLSAFIEEMGKAPPAYVKDWSKEPRRSLAQQAVVYAMALDRLTRLLGAEVATLAAVREHYKRQWREPAFAKAYGDAASPFRDKTNIFLEAKLQSVIPAIKDFIRFISGTAQIAPDDGRVLVPLNISEAVAVDFVAGHSDNARAGIVLAEHPVGQAANAKLDSGPSKLADNKKSVEWRPPLPQKWADLYQTWNMAFVSQAVASPFLFAKLFTPPVGCYQHAPAQYLYNRAIALYLHMHFTMFRVVDAHYPDLGKAAGRPPYRSPGIFAQAKAHFAELAEKASATLSQLTDDENVPAAVQPDAAQAASVMKQLDQKAKEWGDWLSKGLSCALAK